MNTHTPGPWRCYNSKGGRIFQNLRIIDGRSLCIAKIEELPGGESELANAHLIAAAPAMLAALEEANRVLETAKRYFPKSIRNSDTFSLLNVQANAVAKAIAMAKGER